MKKKLWKPSTDSVVVMTNSQLDVSKYAVFVHVIFL
jgi:hypothetical protein